MDFLNQMQSPHMHVEMIQYIITHFLILSNNNKLSVFWKVHYIDNFSRNNLFSFFG